jgi:hypothetical protein
VGTIQNRPAALFDSAFTSRWGITGVTAKTLPTPDAGGNNIPAIVGGVVGGVGGAIVVACLAAFVVWRRRRTGATVPRQVVEDGMHIA